VRGNCC